MAHKAESPSWPPRDAMAYLWSAEFLRCVEGVASRSLRPHERSDALALVIDWLERTCMEDSMWFERGPGDTPRFRSEAHWRRYLASALRHAAQRAAAQRSRFLPIDALPIAWTPPTEHRPGDSALVRAALDKLTPRQRQIVELVLRGLSQAEIARSLGMTRQSVHSDFDRALRTIRSNRDSGADN